MKKRFLYLLLAFLSLNLIYKSVLYFQFEKSIGVVTHHELRSINTNTLKGTRISEAVAPSIKVSFNNKEYNLCKMDWGFFYKIPLNEKVEVLKYKDKEEFEINSFLYYWITIDSLKYIFGLSVLFTALYTSYLDKKNNVE